MAISRVKNWGAEILTYNDLNAEFNNVINNGTDVAFPLTKAVSAGSFNVQSLAQPANATDAVNRNYADDPQMLRNLKLEATVGSNALTISILTKDGSTPTSGSSPQIAFRSSTLATGDFTVRAVTAATTLVVSSGSTLGTVSATAARLYVGAIDNAGTVELCVWNPVTTTGLFAPTEGTRQSTTAEGGAGAADSAGVIYSTTARSNVAMRILGYLDITETTAGTWATAPTQIQLKTPGTPRTGEIVQWVRKTDATQTTGTNVVAVDNTVPPTTEMNIFLQQAITPTNAVHRLRIGFSLNCANNTGQRIVGALFQDATTDALKVSTSTAGATNIAQQVLLFHEMAAGTTSSTTFKAAAACNAGTTTFNGENGGALYNGTLDSYLLIQEIFV